MVKRDRKEEKDMFLQTGCPKSPLPVHHTALLLLGSTIGIASFYATHSCRNRLETKWHGSPCSLVCFDIFSCVVGRETENVV